MYKSIQNNNQCTFQGATISGCYIVIETVSINQVSNLQAYFRVKVYETKAKFLSNPNWYITVDEIPNEVLIQFSADFNQGDIFEKISQEYINKLLSLNQSFDANKITIE